MIDTSALALRAPPSPVAPAGNRVRSEFDQDRDADGRQDAGGRGAASEDGRPDAGAREHRRAAGDVLELSAGAGGGAAVLLSRIVENVIRGLARPVVPSDPRRSLLGVYARQGRTPSAPPMPGARPLSLTPDEAAARLACVVEAGLPAPAPVNSTESARQARVEQIFTHLAAEISRALVDAPAADAAVVASLPDLLHSRLSA